LKNVDLPWKQTISLQSFICELIDEIGAAGFDAYEELISTGTNGNKIQPSFVIDNIPAPSYATLFVVVDNYSKSSTVIDVLAEQLSMSREEAIKTVLLDFVKKQGIDLNYELPLRDVALELLYCLQLATRLYAAGDTLPSADSLEPADSLESEIVSIEPGEDLAVSQSEIEASLAAFKTASQAVFKGSQLISEAAVKTEIAVYLATFEEASQVAFKTISAGDREEIDTVLTTIRDLKEHERQLKSYFKDLNPHQRQQLNLALKKLKFQRRCLKLHVKNYGRE